MPSHCPLRCSKTLIADPDIQRRKLFVTTETVDLREDVDLILEVLAEAYEILEDDLRRDRYRRALDASP